jgi:hypothetical protein
MPRTPEQPQGSDAAAPATRAAFEAALTRTVSATNPAGDDELVDAVREMDAAGQYVTALRCLAVRPRMVLRLDEAVRRTAPYGQRGLVGVKTEAQSPLGVALASSHQDGRVREKAVGRLKELLDQQQPLIELLPFLVVRTADWAGPVRDRARAALATLVHDDPMRLVPVTAPVTLLLGRRERGSFAQQQLLGALLSGPGTAVLDALLASPDPRLRRFALRTALMSRRLPLRTLAAITRRDTDRHCRSLAAEAAVREAAWTERVDLLRQLAGSRYQEVRVEALVGLVRTGRADEVTAYLGDPSALVRATAREAARRTGTDALTWYRDALSVPSPGVIAGLAESGRRDGADSLTPLLGHPEAAVRAAALRGLRGLDAVPVERAVTLLRDPSSKVIRETTAALRTRLGQLPAGLGESLLADRERAAVRRAGYRLLDEPDPVRRLRILLGTAADPDPRLAGMATSAAAVLIHSLHTSPWRTLAVPPAIDPSPDERQELIALAEAAPLLSPRSRQLLYERLDSTAPWAELLRVRHGPHPDTANPLLDVTATFSADNPHAVIRQIQEVLLTVLPHAAGPASDWPDDDRWAELLPAWFVERCAAGTTAREGGTTGWLGRWRGPSGRQHAAESVTAAPPEWRLPQWIDLFGPDGTDGSRGWRWWDAGARTPTTGWIRFGTDGHPYGGGHALRRLIEAAGGYDVELP